MPSSGRPVDPARSGAPRNPGLTADFSRPCPCGSGRVHGQCCAPLVAGAAAADAEALMRSRYCAYVLHDADYLLGTWHPRTRPASLDFDSATKWLELKVKSHHVLDADHAEVEFVARFRVGGRGVRMQELSRFVREEGRWYYVDGDVA